MTLDLAWSDRGLIPAVIQDVHSGVLLMLGWMNDEALAKTRETGVVHFYSRSRGRLWMKGETSGNTLRVRELRVDCDADTIHVLAEPAGPTCHTGRTSCFYRVVDENGEVAAEDDGPGATHPHEHDEAEAPALMLGKLEAVLHARKTSTAEKSYTRSLLDAGFPKILAKLAEEHGELAEVLPAGERAEVVHEAADLVFHMMVGLVARDIPLGDVWRELGRRFGVSGHAEKAARGKAE